MRKTMPNETGLLVVNETVPKGPCCKLLQPGDVLISVNGTLISAFKELESILDESVGKKVSAVLGGLCLRTHHNDICDWL